MLRQSKQPKAKVATPRRGLATKAKSMKKVVKKSKQVLQTSKSTMATAADGELDLVVIGGVCYLSFVDSTLLKKHTTKKLNWASFITGFTN